MSQLSVYFKKFLRIYVKNNLLKNLIFCGVIVLLVNFVISDGMFSDPLKTRSGAFTLVSSFIWIGIFNSIQTICRERAIVKREYMAGLSLNSYILAQMLVHLIISLLQTVLSIIICVLFLDFPRSGTVTGSSEFDFAITVFFMIYCADVLGLLISAIVRNSTTAMTVMPFVLILQLLMSGVLFKLSGASKVIANITISKWGMNAIGTIADVGLYDESVVGAWFVIIGMTVVQGILAAFLLRRVANDKR